MCLCFGSDGVDGVGGGGRRHRPRSGRVGWCYVYVRCESGLIVLMAGPGIRILC